tara:strand:- start:1549 stop:1947 length:399 start_codon:yes stop_codon:yes gene_type:complete
MAIKTESKLWLLIKKNTPSICWNRLENSINAGLPDLIGSIQGHNFFTTELKITYDNKTIRFSPHQIAFHKVNHGIKFIMVSTADLSCLKLFDHSLAVVPRPLLVDYGPLTTIDNTKDKRQWTKLIKIIENKC